MIRNAAKGARGAPLESGPSRVIRNVRIFCIMSRPPAADAGYRILEARRRSKCWGAGHGGHDPYDASDIHVLHQPPPSHACALHPDSRTQPQSRRRAGKLRSRAPAWLARRPRPAGIRRARAGAGHPRIFGRLRDPVDAHAHARGRERSSPALRNPDAAGRERPQQRAAVERTAGGRVLARRRRPSAGRRRHVAAAGGGTAAPGAGVRHLACAGTVAAARARRRRAAQRRRELRAESGDLERPRDRSRRPGCRRTGDRALSRTERPATRPRGHDAALQYADGRNRDPARLRHRDPGAGLGASRQRHAELRQSRPTRSRPKPSPAPMPSAAISICSTARTATKWRVRCPSRRRSPSGCRW